MFAYFRAPVPWTELARRTVAETLEDGCAGLAAQLAFYFLLGLFPALLFLVSLLSYLPVDPAIESALRRLDAVLPAEVLAIVRTHVEQALSGGSGGLLTLGIAGAVWSSSAAMTAIISALNRAYDIEEARPWWKARLVAIGLTIALTLFVVIAFALVLAGSDLAAWIAGRIGAGRAFEVTWTLLQWPLVLVLVVAAVDLVYRFAPNADAEWVWVTPGSLLATGLWLVASFGFKIYVSNFADYAAVYGTIGAVIVLMLWLYVSGFALLIGAELNAEIDNALDSRDGVASAKSSEPRPIGPAAEKARSR